MGKLVLNTALSIDGYIADSNGNVDWLMSFGEDDQSKEDYQNFLSKISITLMGRKTYQSILSFGCPFPYQQQTNFVFSSNSQLSPNEFVQFISDHPEEFVRNLKEKEKEKENGKDIWLVGGQQLSQSLLNAHLIDQMILTIVPIVLGKGIQLFGSISKEHRFKLIQTKTFPSGFVQLTYSRIG